MRRMTAGCREGWMPAAASRVGRSEVVTFRARSWERSRTHGEWQRGHFSKKSLECSYTTGSVGQGTDLVVVLGLRGSLGEHYEPW